MGTVLVLFFVGFGLRSSLRVVELVLSHFWASGWSMVRTCCPSMSRLRLGFSFPSFGSLAVLALFSVSFCFLILSLANFFLFLGHVGYVMVAMLWSPVSPVCSLYLFPL